MNKSMLNELTNKKWKMLVKRESTFLEREIRNDGYYNMLPEPYTLKIKNLIALFDNGFTTQLVEENDIENKKKFLENDINTIGIKNMYLYWDKIISSLNNSSNRLLFGTDIKKWYVFIENYKLARGVVLYSYYLALFLNENNIRIDEIENLQKFYDKSEKACLDSWKKAKVYLEKLSNEKNVSEDYIFYYKNSEIENLHNNLFANEEKLEKRKHSLFLLYNYKKYFIDEIPYTFNIKKMAEKNTANQLIGKMAYKKNFSGTAKLIRKKSDFRNLHKNQVVVISMTTPDVTPYLSNIAGIITDEGGIICHAASISRELKIPCVIGTKFATQTLKDGDLVEVDADSGIVKILEKAKETN